MVPRLARMSASMFATVGVNLETLAVKKGARLIQAYGVLARRGTRSLAGIMGVLGVSSHPYSSCHLPAARTCLWLQEREWVSPNRSNDPSSRGI